MKPIFDRIRNLYDLDAMADRVAVIVGCGGARNFAQSLARSGIGRLILIDGDTVSETNTATQGTFLNEVGLPKVDVMADELRRINPDIEITALQVMLDDAFTDEAFEALFPDGRLQDRPETILMCGCTDAFHPQDRTVKLALKYGMCYLAAQVYAHGAAAEVCYTHPKLSRVCPRCMLASRYEAYAAGYVNDVTSHGTPIYVTDRLNAMKTHIALALLLTGTDCDLGGALEAMLPRSLVLMEFAPDAGKKLGLATFDRMRERMTPADRARFFTEETCWVPQRPNPERLCPYCGSTGDLYDARARFTDTRK